MIMLLKHFDRDHGSKYELQHKDANKVEGIDKLS